MEGAECLRTANFGVTAAGTSRFAKAPRSAAVATSNGERAGVAQPFAGNRASMAFRSIPYGKWIADIRRASLYACVSPSRCTSETAENGPRRCLDTWHTATHVDSCPRKDGKGPSLRRSTQRQPRDLFSSPAAASRRTLRPERKSKTKLVPRPQDQVPSTSKHSPIRALPQERDCESDHAVRDLGTRRKDALQGNDEIERQVGGTLSCG